MHGGGPPSPLHGRLGRRPFSMRSFTILRAFPVSQLGRGSTAAVFKSLIPRHVFFDLAKKAEDQGEQ